jgi:hypothetical protein
VIFHSYVNLPEGTFNVTNLRSVSWHPVARFSVRLSTLWPPTMEALLQAGTAKRSTSATAEPAEAKRKMLDGWGKNGENDGYPLVN